MTIREALERRIPRVRKPIWKSDQCYLRLPLLEDGWGPWAELYDDIVQPLIEVEPGQKLLVLQVLDDDGYVVYDGPISGHEQENYARSYLES